MEKQEPSNILERKDLIFSYVDKIHWLIELKKRKFPIFISKQQKKLKNWKHTSSIHFWKEKRCFDKFIFFQIFIKKYLFKINKNK